MTRLLVAKPKRKEKEGRLAFYRFVASLIATKKNGFVNELTLTISPSHER
jgi:hypothetical protein